ncbi:hypothetical protein [Acetobacter aceti]|uniref:Uncharacterized protein n=1 Tax=Acetobacter aceti TaxID=435 RepID=A0A6S6PMW5_ACEAC|nr:hypothetical protein [Acetobacter aceti]BCI68096.1 hypothetical protein AAJCM20276_27200 [Acetobacter aceti]
MTPPDCACDDEPYNGPLSLEELVQIRRMMGYPAFGGVNSGQQSWRFFQAYGFNEWRIRNMSPDEYMQIRRHLADCHRLEREVYGASGNLDTDQAAVWTRNKSEVSDRIGIYRWARMQLCQFMGIPPGPGLTGRGTAIVI